MTPLTRRDFAAALALMAASGRATADPVPAQAATKVKEVIGHRGSCKDRPENTVASVVRAAEAGADAAPANERAKGLAAVWRCHAARAHKGSPMCRAVESRRGLPEERILI